MSIQIQIRGGTTKEHANFNGVSREITCDTDKQTIVVHDGETPGGFPLAREDLANVTTESIKTRGGMINSDFVGIVFSTPVSNLDGFLLCDGAELSRKVYSRLFERIGETFGDGDGETTFCIPDYRGSFLRGLGGGSAKNFFTEQKSAAPNIIGTFEPVYSNGSRIGFTNLSRANGAFYNAQDAPFWQFQVIGTSFGTVILGINASQCSPVYGRDDTNEIRPINKAINFFIKY